MKNHSDRISWLAALVVAGAATAAAQTRAVDFADLHWRLVGPHRGGWVISVAGVPGDMALH